MIDEQFLRDFNSWKPEIFHTLKIIGYGSLSVAFGVATAGLVVVDLAALSKFGENSMLPVVTFMASSLGTALAGITCKNLWRHAQTLYETGPDYYRYERQIR